MGLTEEETSAFEQYFCAPQPSSPRMPRLLLLFALSLPSAVH